MELIRCQKGPIIHCADICFISLEAWRELVPRLKRLKIPFAETHCEWPAVGTAEKNCSDPFYKWQKLRMCVCSALPFSQKEKSWFLL